MMKCQRINCSKEATSDVHLELRIHPAHEPAVTSRILSLCDEHAVEVTWQNINVDQNWEAICKLIIQSGGIAPNKKYSNLIIKPIQNESIN